MQNMISLCSLSECYWFENISENNLFYVKGWYNCGMEVGAANLYHFVVILRGNQKATKMFEQNKHRLKKYDEGDQIQIVIDE